MDGLSQWCSAEWYAGTEMTKRAKEISCRRCATQTGGGSRAIEIALHSTELGRALYKVVCTNRRISSQTTRIKTKGDRHGRPLLTLDRNCCHCCRRCWRCHFGVCHRKLCSGPGGFGRGVANGSAQNGSVEDGLGRAGSAGDLDQRI